MRTQLGVGVGCDALSIPYAMPAESLCIGVFVGYKSQGTTAIGCAARVSKRGQGLLIYIYPKATAHVTPPMSYLRPFTSRPHSCATFSRIGHPIHLPGLLWNKKLATGRVPCMQYLVQQELLGVEKGTTKGQTAIRRCTPLALPWFDHRKGGRNCLVPGKNLRFLLLGHRQVPVLARASALRPPPHPPPPSPPRARSRAPPPGGQVGSGQPYF
jgi:hypothetical protein